MAFTDLYSRLPAMCPSYEAKDLSPPIAFVALLHMCNEKVGIYVYVRICASSKH